MWKTVEVKAEKSRLIKTKRIRKEENKEKEKKKKQKKDRIMEVKNMEEEWEIWDEEKEVTKSKEEANKLVPWRFHK